jgi:small subunit ribosomal protein S6
LRDYETVIVLHPSYEDKEVEAEIQAVTEIISGSDGEVLEVDRWGRRRLAYEIGKAHEGIYTLIRWRGESRTPDDIKRRFRLNERMLRFMTIISEGPPPLVVRSETESPAPVGEPGPVPVPEREPDAVPAIDPAPAASADGPAAE